MQTDSDWKVFDAIAAEARRPARVEKLAYRAPGTVSVPVQSGLEAEPKESVADRSKSGSAAGVGAVSAPPPDPALADLENRLRAAEAGAEAEADRLRREGREAADQARSQAERQGKAALDRAVREIGSALESFRREREEYFARVEREVVELALAIAARILHREALLDPMLLSGAVRVALDQLGETTGVRLRCPGGETERWRELLSALPLPPEVAGDPGMVAGECVLEARIGAVDLGVKAQLGEIERGFFDLLEQRPGAVERRAVARGPVA